MEELGVNWEKYRETGDLGIVTSDYPQLARLIDELDDVVYSPDAAEALFSECIRAEEVVKRPESIRGLDKLLRIARRAQQSKLGIYFMGED